MRHQAKMHFKKTHPFPWDDVAVDLVVNIFRRFLHWQIPPDVFVTNKQPIYRNNFTDTLNVFFKFLCFDVLTSLQIFPADSFIFSWYLAHTSGSSLCLGTTQQSQEPYRGRVRTQVYCKPSICLIVRTLQAFQLTFDPLSPSS